MAKPEMDLNLAAEVEKYGGDDKSQGDPNKPAYVDPANASDEGGDDDADDADEADEAEEGADEGGEDGEEGEGDDADESDDADDDGKPKKTAKARIAELTAARRQAERDAAYWRGKALEAQQTHAKAHVGTAGEAPDPSKFDYGEADPAYIAALASHSALKALDERNKSSAEQQHNEALQGAFGATVARGRANFADFDSIVIEGANNGSWDCSEDLALQLVDSEKGDEIAYFLAKNPSEARRLSALPFRSLAREIGRLEVSLEKPPVVKPKVISDAQTPPKRTAKGGGRAGGYDPEAGAYDANFEKWANGQIGRRR